MMTNLHTCSYFCDRPACIKAQRDELRERLIVEDRGPWRVLNGGKLLISEDFTRDVQLELSGDFSSPEQRLLYALTLARKLNSDDQKMKH